MNVEIIHEIQAGPFWDWKVALDLFLGGAGVGAFLVAVFLDERFDGKFRRVCHTAAHLAPVLIIAGLVLVLVKMGRPFHLFLAYTNFNPTAPLWWGGIFQPILIVGAIIYALKWRGAEPRDPARRWIGRLLAPIAVIVGGYHGLLLGVMVARPLWNTGPTVVAALLGFASTGIAVVMLVHLIRMKVRGRLEDEELVATFLDSLRVIRNTLVTVLVLQLFTFFFWYLSLKYGSLHDREALAVANESYGPMFWWLGIGLGLVVPLVLGGFVVLLGEASHRRLQCTVIGVTSSLILVGGFFIRLAVVLAGQIELPMHLLS